MVGADGGILPGCGLEPVFYPLLDVVRQAGRVAVKTVGDDAADAELYLLDLGVELTKLGREVETLLDEQILDRGLEGSLAFREKRLKVVPRERIAEQDVERGGRDEVGEMRWVSRVARTVDSPFSAMNSGMS